MILLFWGQRLPWKHLISLPPTPPFFSPLACAVMVAFRCRGNRGASKDQAKGARGRGLAATKGRFTPLAKWADGGGRCLAGEGEEWTSLPSPAYLSPNFCQASFFKTGVLMASRNDGNVTPNTGEGIPSLSAFAQSPADFVVQK